MAELDGVWAYAWHILAHVSEKSLAHTPGKRNHNTSYYLLPCVLSLRSRMNAVKSLFRKCLRRFRALSPKKVNRASTRLQT